MQTPILLPELGVDRERIRVNSWLVDLGDFVEAGDRVVEVAVPGISFDVSAPQAGFLRTIHRSADATIHTGDVLGWIESGWIEPQTSTESQA